MKSMKISCSPMVWMGLMAMIFVATPGILVGQELFPPGLFGEKTMPGETRDYFPVVCDEGMFSSERPAISNDGRDIYFSELVGWDNPSQYAIHWYHHDGTTWNKPEILFEGFLAPSLSPDEKTMYVQRIDQGRVSVWYSMRSNSGWASPQPLNTTYPSVSYYTLTESGRVYGMVNGADSVGGVDLCVQEPTKGDSFASLGKPLNTKANDKDFYMAPDESFVVFTSADASRAKTRQGDLCISFRRADGSWTAPLGLGPQVNVGGDGGHWGPWVSRDRKVLFFTTGASASSIGIHWIAFTKLFESLKQKVLP